MVLSRHKHFFFFFEISGTSRQLNSRFWLLCDASRQRLRVTDEFGSIARSLSSSDGNEVYCPNLELVCVQEEEVLLSGMIILQQVN